MCVCVWVEIEVCVCVCVCVSNVCTCMGGGVGGVCVVGVGMCVQVWVCVPPSFPLPSSLPLPPSPTPVSPTDSVPPSWLSGLMSVGSGSRDHHMTFVALETLLTLHSSLSPRPLFPVTQDQVPHTLTLLLPDISLFTGDGKLVEVSVYQRGNILYNNRGYCRLHHNPPI